RGPAAAPCFRPSCPVQPCRYPWVLHAVGKASSLAQLVPGLRGKLRPAPAGGLNPGRAGPLTRRYPNRARRPRAMRLSFRDRGAAGGQAAPRTAPGAAVVPDAGSVLPVFAHGMATLPGELGDRGRRRAPATYAADVAHADRMPRHVRD